MIGQTLLGKKYFQFIILTSGQKNCLVLKRRVCQRQTRKEKIWLRLRERLKLVIPRQEKKCVGGWCQKLSSLLQCCWGVWTRPGPSGEKEAGDRASAASHGNSMQRGSTTGACLAAWLWWMTRCLAPGLSHQPHCWGHPCLWVLEQEIEE